MQLLRYLRTFWGPSWFLPLQSLEFCYICYFCDFWDICHGCFKLARNILVTFATFAIFADILGPFLISSFAKSRILLHLLLLRFLRYLRTFWGPSWLLCFLSLEFCYICYFCDICHGCFKLARKILVTFAIFAIIADISGPFLVSSFSKSRILLNFCYICDFCGHFGVFLRFFFLSLDSC